VTTATDTTLDLIQALDFDPAVNCESSDGCAITARWLCVFDCCGANAALCHPHKTGKEKNVDERSGDPTRQMRCSRCLNELRRDQIRFERLGGH
jgi:hypothetical protein